LPADTQWRSEEFVNSEGPSAEPWTTLELMPREEEVTELNQGCVGERSEKARHRCCPGVEDGQVW